jgi:disulfide bond formation protein DsbB
MKLSSLIPLWNVLWVLVLLGVLLGSLYIQFFIGDEPCRLCTWQRMTMFFIMAVLLLNLRFGQSTLNYGLIILFSLFGSTVSIRQILSYIMPGNPGFGPVVFGLHTYTWALLVFACSILASAIMLIIGIGEKENEIKIKPVFIKGLFGIAMALTLTFSVATVNQCGLDACPAATEYLGTSPDSIKALVEECCPDPKKK